MKHMIFTALIGFLPLSAAKVDAATLTYDFSWQGSGGYTLEGRFGFDDSKGPIVTEDDLDFFFYEAFLNGETLSSTILGSTVVARFDSSEEQRDAGPNTGPWNEYVSLSFDRETETFGDSLLLNSPDIGTRPYGYSFELRPSGQPLAGGVLRLFGEPIPESQSSATLVATLATPTPVPIPGAALLLVTGVAILAGVRRRLPHGSDRPAV